MNEKKTKTTIEKDPSDNIWSRIVGYILMFMFLTTPKDKEQSPQDKGGE